MQTSQIKIVDTILGSSFVVMEPAIPLAQKRNLDIRRSLIELLRRQEITFVLFTLEDGNRSDFGRKFGVLQGPYCELSSAKLDSYLSHRDQLETLDHIHGKHFVAVEASVKVFQERLKNDLVRYRIAVARESDFLFVTFTDKDGKAGVRGAPGTQPGFEVQLNAADLKIIRSNFLR